MRGSFEALSILVVVGERAAQVSTVIHYFLTSQHHWAWWTFSLLLPACLVQVLSFKWFRVDGHKECCSLTTIHVLQLGMMKRYWDSFWVTVKECDGRASNSGELLMKLGDLSLLRLLEALLQTLPHLLLQAYIYLALDEADLYPGVSAGLSLLSLSWALVCYSRFMCLLKPGHLYMPWAALLCQLLWRMGMLGTRVMTLAVFARVYHFWTLAAAGAHWLVMSFWFASQQTDIISRTCHWKMFNILIGAVYLFCYINFRDGSSRCRVIIFYSVMLIENIILLLLATDFLQEALWSSVWMTLAVMAGFIIGAAALIIYYSLLHPKSTQISQNFKAQLCKPGTWKDTADQSVFQPESKNRSSRGGFDTLEVITMNCSKGVDAGTSDINLDHHATWIKTYVGHHHWLLLKLALKTGALSKINAAFGDGGIAEIFPHGSLASSDLSSKTVPGGAAGQKFPLEEKKHDLWEISDYVTVESEHESDKFRRVLPTVREEHGAEPAEISSCNVEEPGEVQSDNRWHSGIAKPLVGATAGPEEVVGQYTKRLDTCDNSTLYFSADMEGVSPSCGSHQPITRVALRQANESALASVPEKEEIQEELFPVSGISPIAGGTSHSNFRRSTAVDLSSQCDDSTDTSEFMAQEGILGAQYSHLMVIGNLAASLQSRLKQEETPCFTSTPKPEQTAKKIGAGEPKARKKLTQLAEMQVAE
ncbi:XK-related protein 5 [Ambystoma mexicanum]|uniref:XK-related protein 5 n=1 Tax=Ambystoma mexicanum TaxID=8296 RepID=UPI0037E94FE2